MNKWQKSLVRYLTTRAINREHDAKIGLKEFFSDVYASAKYEFNEDSPACTKAFLLEAFKEAMDEK